MLEVSVNIGLGNSLFYVLCQAITQAMPDLF